MGVRRSLMSYYLAQLRGKSLHRLRHLLPVDVVARVRALVSRSALPDEPRDDALPVVATEQGAVLPFRPQGDR